MRNRILLAKCIVLGAFTFPTPFLIFLYVFNIGPNTDDYANRFSLVLFLFLAGGIIGLGGYYKDAAIHSLKDWFPSGP